jgi:hypothetical protein
LLLHQLFSPFDVSVLRTLIHRAQQDNDGVSLPRKVDPVARAIINPHFHDLTAESDIGRRYSNVRFVPKADIGNLPL